MKHLSTGRRFQGDNCCCYRDCRRPGRKPSNEMSWSRDLFNFALLQCSPFDRGRCTLCLGMKMREVMHEVTSFDAYRDGVI